MLKIRAHHFLCMQGFQGYGYSNEFVDNMSKVIKYIKENKNENIKLIDNCDDICSACTNNINGQCDDFYKVDAMDKKVLNKLSLKSGEVVKLNELFALVNEKIKDKRSAQEICGACSWHEKCLWFLNIK